MPIEQLLKKSNKPDYRPKSTNMYDLLERVKQIEQQQGKHKQDFCVKTLPLSSFKDTKRLFSSSMNRQQNQSNNSQTYNLKSFTNQITPQQQYLKDKARSERYFTPTEEQKLALSNIVQNPWLKKAKFNYTNSVDQKSADNLRKIPASQLSLFNQLKSSGKEKYGVLLQQLIDKEVQKQNKTSKISHESQAQQDELRSSRQFQKLSNFDIKNYMKQSNLARREEKELDNLQTSNINTTKMNQSLQSNDDEVQDRFADIIPQFNKFDENSAIPEPFSFITEEDIVKLHLINQSSQFFYEPKQNLAKESTEEQCNRLSDTIHTVLEESSNPDIEENNIDPSRYSLSIKQYENDNKTPQELQLSPQINVDSLI